MAEQERDERIAAWQAEQAAETARLAAIDRAELERAVAAMRRQFPPSAASLRRRR